MIEETIIADIDSIIKTKNNMDVYYEELLSMVNKYQEMIENTQDIYYSDSAILYRNIADRYIEIVKNYMSNEFKEFIDRIDDVRKIYSDEYNEMQNMIQGGKQ